MERTNKPASGTIRWQKIGGGSFRLKNRIIKPNQKFSATEDEIPQAFRDVVVRLGDVPAAAETPPIKAVDSSYTLKARGKGGWYDVVNSSGKVLNEKALKKEVAEKLIEDLAK